MALFLLFEALLELLDQLFQPTQALDLGLVLFRELLHKLGSQPVVRNHRLNNVVEGFQVLEMQPESAVKAVVIFFVLDQNRPGQRIKIIHVAKREPLLHRLKQIEQLPGRHRHPVVFQHMKEINQHWASGPRADA